MMNFSPKSKKTILTAVILLIAVATCCLLLGPQTEPKTDASLPTVAEVVSTTAQEEAPDPTFPMEGDAIVVSTVDELLSALGSDRSIILEPGVYDLTKAADYGSPASENPSYHWEDTYVDGYQLVIRDVDNLTLTGRDKEKCEIVTSPRYAAVLSYQDCKGITLSGITAGHTEGPGECVGSVVNLVGCSTVNIENCILYGCGTYGVDGGSNNNVTVSNCDIKECSMGAVNFWDCENIQLTASRVYDCTGSLFSFYRCKNCAVDNTEITNNLAGILLDTATCRDIYFISNKLENNTFGLAYFNINGAHPIVDQCGFDADGSTMAITVPNLSYDTIPKLEPTFVLSPDGKELWDQDLLTMTYSPSGFILPPMASPAPTMPAFPTDINTDGTTQVTVSTVDAFLAAIAPNTTVILAEGNYDLSTASDYGTGWTDYYRWSDEFDGYELEIMNVENFHIKGAGQNKTILTAVPRYADVLVFTGCSDISVQGLTAGHTIEPGYCTGGVLNFLKCSNAAIDSCGLYGCGIFGIMAEDSLGFAVTNTEIYDCSYGAVCLHTCSDFAFDNCNIHDCPMPYFCGMGGCENITMNGEAVY